MFNKMKQDFRDRYVIPYQLKYQAKLRNNLDVILCNLLAASQVDEDVWTGFLAGNDFYHYKRRTKGFRFSTSSVVKIRNFLYDHDFIELITGYPESDCWEAQPSKMKAT